MAFNGLSVILNKTTTEILADKSSLERCTVIMEEVIEAAKACGVNLPIDLADQMLSFTSGMRPYYPSMKLDYDFSRPMGIEYIYQRPIMIAMKAGFNMQESTRLYNQLKKKNN